VNGGGVDGTIEGMVVREQSVDARRGASMHTRRFQLALF